MATRPNVNLRYAQFKLKPAIINMVQANPLYGKLYEDTNTHLKHFIKVSSTLMNKGVTLDVICLHFFSILLCLESQSNKQWFYANRQDVTT